MEKGCCEWGGGDVGEVGLMWVERKVKWGGGE